MVEVAERVKAATDLHLIKGCVSSVALYVLKAMFPLHFVKLCLSMQ